MVYSAVVRKDGKKTTVKTTHRMESLTTANSSRHQTPVMRGWSTALWYVKDGKKTTVKTMATTQNEKLSST